MLKIIVLAATCVGFALPFTAHAQDTGSRDRALDALAQKNQQARGPRDWGKPVEPAKAAPLEPAPVGTVCMSTASDFPAVFSRPSQQAKKLGVAAPTVAVLSTSHGAWRKILRSHHQPGWILGTDLTPFHPMTPSGSPHCRVAGVRPDGSPVFAYTR